MFTYSKYLFDVITKCSSTNGRLQMIDIQNVSKAYDLGKISNIGLVVWSENNPADAFSKVKANSLLQNIILHNCANFQVEQWVYHSKEANDYRIPKMEGVLK